MKWIVAILILPSVVVAQAGWKSVTDKTGVCQISVPPNWVTLSTPGMVNSPESTTTMVLSGMSPFRPYDDQTLKMLNTDKVYENSAQRTFYRTKPNSGLVNYHIEVPGKAKRCTAQLTLSLKYSEDEAKKIGMTLGPVR